MYLFYIDNNEQQPNGFNILKLIMGTWEKISKYCNLLKY